MSQTGLVRIEDGAQIAFNYRNPGKGVPLAFCPGLGGTQKGFKADAEYFSSLGRSVLTVDLRGLGESKRPKEMTQAAFTPQRMAQDIQALMHHCGIEQVDFVGNSLGGVIGLELIRQQPDAVRSLTTFGTTYHLDLPRVIATIQTIVLRIIGRKRLPRFVAGKSSTHDCARETIREQFATFPFDVGYRMAKNIAKYDYREVAVNCAKPILMIQGSLDTEINRHLDTTLEALKDSDHFTVAQLAEAGHFTNLDKPQEVRDLITRFLDEHFHPKAEAGVT